MISWLIISVKPRTLLHFDAELPLSYFAYFTYKTEIQEKSIYFQLWLMYFFNLLIK